MSTRHFTTDSPEGSVELELESLLESLSLDLMKDNISRQIQYESSSTTDFLSTIISKFRVILEMDGIDDDDMREVRFQMVEFCDELITEISGHYELFMTELPDDYDTKIEILETLYNFFVLNRFSNVEKFLINYINKNKSELIEALGIDDKSKDITSMSNKKKNITRENVCILSSMTEIINHIRSNIHIGELEFINTINDGEYYADKLGEYYTNAEIAGNFTSILLNEVLDDAYDSNELARIRNDIRIAFYE